MFPGEFVSAVAVGTIRKHFCVAQGQDGVQQGNQAYGGCKLAVPFGLRGRDPHQELGPQRIATHEKPGHQYQHESQSASE
ncbi:MAG TPA: hypothetical protein DIS96_05805 [Pusillimonas sp.]|nr:hypothetical protein [Pusillimonas sp.]